MVVSRDQWSQQKNWGSSFIARIPPPIPREEKDPTHGICCLEINIKCMGSRICSKNGWNNWEFLFFLTYSKESESTGLIHTELLQSESNLQNVNSYLRLH
ncbi:hypothetical protein NPIL_216191 [Nephila pilipes]|uniref:Uncharacterized protein n=1 Tax=Nephila pilipes TaxID=299642 RepID=A0A8X6NEJ3_NEPPI|nr:hypothetical protein NPIL_216191 [Nephila pilipes]